MTTETRRETEHAVIVEIVNSHGGFGGLLNPWLLDDDPERTLAANENYRRQIEALWQAGQCLTTSERADGTRAEQIRDNTQNQSE